MANQSEVTPDPVTLAGHPLQQIALTTTDLPRSISFYKEVLGLPFLFQSNDMAFFDVAGMRLMLALDAKRPKGRPTSILYFDTPNLDATIKRLETLGVTFDGPIETVQSTAKGDLKLRQFYDPDGNALAVIAFVTKN